MAEYYLISQLPSLDGISDTVPMPITEARFLELCERFLGRKAQQEIQKLTLVPPLSPKISGSNLVNAWNDGERKLRLALGKVRAEKMKTSFAVENTAISAELVRVAGTAAEMKSPMEAEKFLSDYRLSFLETLRPMDNFSDDYLYYYGLKLKLLLRMRQFDKTLGEAAYKNMYHSILNEDRLEATI